MSLPAGEYTVSLIALTSSCLDTTAAVKVYPNGSTTPLVSESIPLSESANYYAPTPIQVNFTVSTAGIYTVAIEVTGGATASTSGRVQVGCVALGKNTLSGYYNMVSSGSFEASYAESGSATSLASSFWTYNNGALVLANDADGKYGTSVKVTGDVESQRYVSQVLYQATDSMRTSFKSNPDSYLTYLSGVDYIVHGFGKATEAMGGSLATFEIRIDLAYYQPDDTTYVVSKHYRFNPYVEEWQTVLGTFRTKEADADAPSGTYFNLVDSITIYLEYGHQANGYALFDNIYVCPDVDYRVRSNTYYNDGKLQVMQVGSYVYSYEYDEEDRLILEANNRGEAIRYFYSDSALVPTTTVTMDYNVGGAVNAPIWGELTEVTFTPKLVTEYSYNTFGQCIKTETSELTSNTVTLSKSAFLILAYDNLTSVFSVSKNTAKKAIVTSASYHVAATPLRGFCANETDADGNTVAYEYGSMTELLKSYQTETGEGYSYVYNTYGELIAVQPIVLTNGKDVPEAYTEYAYDMWGRLSIVLTASSSYTFTYNVFGAESKIEVGSQTLVSYTYNDYNGKLASMTYGNGTVVRYEYDALDRLSKVLYTVSGGTETLAYTYEYTSDGQVSSIENHESGRVTVFRYNSQGQLITCVAYDDTELSHELTTYVSYNANDQVSEITNQFRYATSSASYDSSVVTSYTYNADGSLGTSKNKVASYTYYDTLTYDEYDRVSEYQTMLYQTSASNNCFYITYTYGYTETEERTTAKVQTFGTSRRYGTGTAVNSTATYTYDANGNITRIVYSDGNEVRYAYDGLGQLVREDNTYFSRTYVYVYDNGGNITAKKIYNLTAAGVTPSSLITTYGYGYEPVNGWGDLLTLYRGQTITYDENGNPLSYYNGNRFTFTWKNGRQLATASGLGRTMSFSYDADGLRVSKTVDGVQHLYYYNGSELFAEIWGEHTVIYLYDAMGSPTGMQYRNNTYASGVFDVYRFEKNLHGDIIAVYDALGTRLISYVYDAWGGVSYTYENGGEETGAYYNAMLYRGYYYDSDLGLYYLQSRYYDSRTGRFINADGYVSTGTGILGYNMFAYCNNNPVMYVDYTGNEPISMTLYIGLITCLFISSTWLIHDVTHEQVLGNMFVDATDALVASVNQIVDAIRSFSNSKADEKDEIITDTKQYNYWTASIVNGVVTPGMPLTYSQAREWVAAENDLLCRNHAAAIAIVKFYPSANWEPAHRGGIECGYLNHYHLSHAHNCHIWYYGE